MMCLYIHVKYMICNGKGMDKEMLLSLYDMLMHMINIKIVSPST